ncbi:MAG: OprO/OprP family phosphate-selective porin [Gammaproteobacteria bacterium]
MKPNKLSMALLALMGGAAIPAYALDVYMDTDTKQIFGEPGPGRVKVGSFERFVEATPAKPAADKEEIKQEVEKAVQAATKDIPEVNTKGKLEIKSKDGEFKWRLKGRIHVNAGVYGNDDASNGRNTDFQDGASIRRARLALEATLWKYWGLKLQYDFAAGAGAEGIRDMYITYRNDQVWPVLVTLGQFKEYIGLESVASSNDLTFIERALPSRAFSPPDARRIGIGAHTYGHDLWTLGLGFYGRNADGEDLGGVPVGRSDPFVFAGRTTFSPIHREGAVLHLGFGGTYTAPDDTTRFRERPELTPGTQRLVDTGTLSNVANITHLVAEAAGVYGPFSLQGEYTYVDVNRNSGFSNPTFDGWYIQGSWILTGESREYEFEDGIFKNPKPSTIVGHGGIGAWEIAARYSSMDLNSVDISGGREENFTAGLNWYPAPNFKFMANYVKVLNLTGGGFDGAEPDGFLMRGQVIW